MYRVSQFVLSAFIVCAPCGSRPSNAATIISNDVFSPRTCVGETFQLSQVQVLCDPSRYVTEVTVSQLRQIRESFNTVMDSACGSLADDFWHPNVARAVQPGERVTLTALAASITKHQRDAALHLKACNPVATGLDYIYGMDDLAKMKALLMGVRARASSDYKRRLLVNLLDQLDQGLSDMSGGESGVASTLQAVNPDDLEVYMKMYPKVFSTVRDLLGGPPSPAKP